MKMVFAYLFCFIFNAINNIIDMRVKIEKARMINYINDLQTSSNSHPHINAIVGSPKEIVMKHQANTIHNYFSLLKNIFHRNKINLTKIKKAAENDMSDLVLEDANHLFNTQISQQTPKKHINQLVASEATLTITEQQKPNESISVPNQCKSKWKNYILRRRNNGSHGEIIKGFAAPKHTSIVQKIKVKSCESHQPQKSKRTISHVSHREEEDFIPLGNLVKESQQPSRRFSHIEKVERYDMRLQVCSKKMNENKRPQFLRKKRCFKRIKTEKSMQCFRSFYQSHNKRFNNYCLSNLKRADKTVSPWQINGQN